MIGSARSPLKWLLDLPPSKRAIAIQRLTLPERAAVAQLLDEAESRRWAQRFRDRPVDFAVEVLGIDPWSRQREILEAVSTHSRVAVRSGHKIGKSTSAAVMALWWVSTRERGQVVLTSATDRQVRLILWPEVQRLYRAARRPLGGDIHDAPATGLVYGDGRRVVGFATDRPEAMAGFSGAELLFIADEASGIDEAIFDAIEGNRAGGARLVMLGNPTQTSGRFYSAFHDARHLWNTHHVSSEEAAAFQQRERSVPGLATQEWIDEKRLEWGEGSPLYQVRARGDFPAQATDAVIGLGLVEAARRRWHEAVDDGVLELGIDVARFGDDDTVIFPMRGKKALSPLVLHGLDGPAIAGKVIELATSIGKRDANGRMLERPRCKVDVIGVGASVYDQLVQSPLVEVIAVNVGEGPSVDGYVRLRDQLWFTAREWLKDGGALPDCPKLEGELLAPRYSVTVANKIQVEPKETTKKRLKRSPDHADALCLAIFNPPSYVVGTFESPLENF